MDRVAAKDRAEEFLACAVPIIIGFAMSTLSGPMMLVAVLLLAAGWNKLFIQHSLHMVISVIPFAWLSVGLIIGLFIQHFLP